MANTRQKQKTRSANAGGSGDILLAAFIMRPQSESQIGAVQRNYTSNQGLESQLPGFQHILLIHCG